MKKILFILYLLLANSGLFAQRIHGSTGFHIPRDKVKLKNQDSETGKIIYSDSSKVTLMKYDYSEKNISRTEIDTIVGLSYFTYFFAPSLGFGSWNGLISQRLDTFSSSATTLSLKAGYMRKKHFAANAELGYQGGSKHSLFHFGLGIRRYIFSDYVKKKNFYLGLNFGYNFPLNNMNRFFDLGWCAGYEYLLKEKYRLYIEYNNVAAQKYDPKPRYAALNIGMRFSIEYLNHYKKLNL